MMRTESEIAYHDALRQVHRSLQRRLKVLEEESKNCPEEKQAEYLHRMAEVEHILGIVESLHR